MAGKRVTQLDAATELTADDVFVIVNNPDDTDVNPGPAQPTTQKISAQKVYDFVLAGLGNKVGAVETSTITSVLIPNTSASVASSDHYEPRFFYEHDPDAYGYYVELNYIGEVGPANSIDFQWFCAVDATFTAQNVTLAPFTGGGLGATTLVLYSQQKALIPETITGSISYGGTVIQTFTVNANGDFAFTAAQASSVKVTSATLDAWPAIFSFNWNAPIAAAVIVNVDFNYRAYTTRVSGSLIAQNETGIVLKTIPYTADQAHRPFIVPDTSPIPPTDKPEVDDVLRITSDDISGVCAIKCSAFFIGYPPIAFINEPAIGLCHGTTTIHKFKFTPNTQSYLNISLLEGNLTAESTRRVVAY